jgi:hypothetical protein
VFGYIKTGTEMDLGLSRPIADRVAARAVVIAVVSCRGFVDADASLGGNFWNRVRDWFSALGLDGELECSEQALIAKPLGSLARQEQVDAMWLCESMTVLAWALGRYPMPPYDQQIVAAEVADTLGLLKPYAETVLAKPSLRPVSELAALGDGIFAVHWRLVEFRVTQQPIDFPAIAENAWWGPMSLALARLIDGDLAIGSTRIDKTEERLCDQCLSIVRERHRAVNWLLGKCEVFSEVDTST